MLHEPVDVRAWSDPDVSGSKFLFYLFQTAFIIFFVLNHVEVDAIRRQQTVDQFVVKSRQIAFSERMTRRVVFRPLDVCKEKWKETPANPIIQIIVYFRRSEGP